MIDENLPMGKFICPECGARSDESRSDMFSTESAIRVHDAEGIETPWLECKKCGHTWDKQ